MPEGDDAGHPEKDDTSSQPERDYTPILEGYMRAIPGPDAECRSRE